MIRNLMYSFFLFICLNLLVFFYNIYKVFGSAMFKIDFITFFQTTHISCFLSFYYILVVLLISFIFFISINKFNKKADYYKLIFFFFLLVFCVGIMKFFLDYNVFCYIFHKIQYSDFYENNYVDAKKVNIKVPEQKKNLILIFVENIDFKFAEKNIFRNNSSSETDNLSENNISFKYFINGYSQYTAQMSLISILSGIPCPKLLSKNYLIQQNKNYLPRLYMLSDILKDNDYQTLFIQSSNTDFEGLKLFLKMHHFDEALNLNDIFENYDENQSSKNIFWVENVINAIKMNIMKLDKNKPFFVTIFAVDTCCENSEISNISRDRYDRTKKISLLVQKFIAWLKKQPFADNTVFVIIGDNSRMDDFIKESENDICKLNKNVDYECMYNCFINPVDKNKEVNKKRLFCQFDLFPTILESLSFEIQGSKLGLGTSLFSEKKTVLEEFGKKEVNSQLAKKNKIYNNLLKYK